MATFSYLFLFAILIHSGTNSFIECTANIGTDQYILLSLKAHLTLDDPNNILATNWSTSSPICYWIGISCGSRHHRVVALDISNMGLSSQLLPASCLGNLSFLSFLNMSNNNLHGNLPKDLAFLHRLKVLDLSFNDFTGEIPQQLGDLRSLMVINTHTNHLTGAFPNSIFNISTLEHIDFSNNNLSGILPSNICHQLPTLKILILYLNGFNGPLPANLSTCPKLRVLSLSSNMFDGLIPKELGKLEMLEKLLIGGNNLTGTIPHELGNLHNLKLMAMEENQIIGR